MYYPWVKVNADRVSVFSLSETSSAAQQNRYEGECGLSGTLHIRGISKHTWQKYAHVKCQENSTEKAGNRDLARTPDKYPTF